MRNLKNENFLIKILITAFMKGINIEIIKTFILALKKLFENAYRNVNEIPVKLGKYLITVLYKISSNKELIKNNLHLLENNKIKYALSKL